MAYTQNWDSKGNIYYTDENGQVVNFKVNPFTQLANKAKATAYNVGSWINETNPNSEAYKQKVSAILGLVTAPMGLGATLTGGIAKGLVPVVGRKIAQNMAQGIGSGVVGGAIGGGAEAGLNNKNIAVGGLLGATTGGLLGGLGGYGLGKVAQKLNTQTAWHGSPYKFDKFDNAYIGTGEGAQAHGYGHYSAKSKDVGEKYRQNLTVVKQLTDTNNPRNKYIDLKNTINDMEELKKKLGANNPIVNEVLNEAKLKMTELQKKFKPEQYLNDSTGQLYKLSIPKDDVMLREGATFAEQPVKVQNAIREIIKENPGLSELIDTRTADEFFEIAQNKLGKKGKNIMKEVFDAELSGDENKITNAWEKYTEFVSKNPNITRTDFDANEIYGYLRNYRKNGADEIGQLFQNQHSNTNLYKYLEDERNFNKRLYDKGIKGISYNGDIDGEANVIFNPDDIDIIPYYDNPTSFKEKFINLLNR